MSVCLSMIVCLYVCLSQVVFKDNIQIVTQERVVHILKKPMPWHTYYIKPLWSFDD
jgi:hypothetical protein